MNTLLTQPILVGACTPWRGDARYGLTSGESYVPWSTITCWSLYTWARRSKIWLDIRRNLCSPKHHYLLELVHLGEEKQAMVGHQGKVMFPEAPLLVGACTPGQGDARYGRTSGETCVPRSSVVWFLLLRQHRTLLYWFFHSYPFLWRERIDLKLTKK